MKWCQHHVINRIVHLVKKLLNYRVATFELVQNSLTVPWQNNVFPWQFILFFKVKNTHLVVIKGNPTTYLGFLKDNSLTVIISRPWVYICQADVYINTTQVDPLLYYGSFNLKKCHNKIPWQFPDMDQVAKIPWQFPDMDQVAKIPWHFSEFPDFLPTWRKFRFSLTFSWHEAKLSINVYNIINLKVSSYKMLSVQQ